MTKKFFSVKNICILSVVFVLIAVLVATVCYVYATKNIFAGVECAGVSVAGMNEEEAQKAVETVIGTEYGNKELKLILDGNEKKIKLSDFAVKYDVEKTILELKRYGREGNAIQRVTEAVGALFKGHQHEMSISYDNEALLNKVNELLHGMGTPVKEFSYEIEGDKFYIINGTPGDMPDSSVVAEKIVKAVKLCSYEEKLVFEKEMRNPEPVDVNKIHNELSGVVQDARYEYVAGVVNVIPHKYHVDFNKEEAQEIVDLNTEYGKKYSLPAVVSVPKLTEKEAKERLFTQVIGSYKTDFNAGQINRSSNIVLAAKSINGTILMPGDEFSYNKVVGERTTARGYKMAPVYINGGVEDGIGGGICQVSSTLYCAVLYANLEVTERDNHMFSVGYVPLGQDATVDWGNIDFKFKNNTGYPMRVLITVESGKVYVSIEGYKEVKEEIELIPVRVASNEPKIEKVDDPTLPVGTEEIESQGSPGAVVELYKVVKVNGVAQPRAYVSRSSYSGGKTIVKVGTGVNLPPVSPEGTVNPEVMTDGTPESMPTPQSTPQSTPAPATPAPVTPATPAPEDKTPAAPAPAPATEQPQNQELRLPDIEEH